MSGERVLELDGLRVDVRRDGTAAALLEGVSLGVDAGQCVGIVGESGCGKSLTLRAALGLLPPGVEQVGGTVRYRPRPGAPLAAVEPAQAAGRGLAMVFQDSQAALDPTMRVGRFVAETVRRRTGCGRREARRRAHDLLADVGIPAPELRARAYPHELSGGLRQRAAIALALATEPRVLLCDEPTTALDVTLQAQILALLNAMRAERGLGMVFVSHDIAVIRQVADVVAVMYAGQIVEVGPAARVLDHPRHPYAQALIGAVPAIDRPVGRFLSVAGAPPDPSDYDTGCRFRWRCPHAATDCGRPVGGLDARDRDHRSACLHEHAPAVEAGARP